MCTAHFRLRRLLPNNAGADLNDPDLETTPLCQAFQEKEFEIAKLLIENGARVDVFDALFIDNIDNDQLEVIQMLIQHGADVNKRHPRLNITPLFYAIAINRNLDDIVKFLITHGADTNIKDLNGNSLLHVAIQDRQLSIVKTLVEAEKCLHDKNLQSLKPLEYDLVLRKNLIIAKVFMYLQ